MLFNSLLKKCEISQLYLGIKSIVRIERKKKTDFHSNIRFERNPCSFFLKRKIFRCYLTNYNLFITTYRTVKQKHEKGINTFPSGTKNFVSAIHLVQNSLLTQLHLLPFSLIIKLILYYSSHNTLYFRDLIFHQFYIKHLPYSKLSSRYYL